MSKITSEKRSLVPVFVMLGFTLILIAALLMKVYSADRDLGKLRSEKYQARLASESGINYALVKMREAIKNSSNPIEPDMLTSIFFEDCMEMDKWIEFGIKTRALFRVTSIRKLSIDDDKATALINEGQQYQIIAEGLCGNVSYSTAAIVQIYDIAKLFGVFQSLDEYYYGSPLIPYIVAFGSFNAFYEANSSLFEEGKLTTQGKILDPLLLVKMFEPNGKSPFKTVDNSDNNYFKYHKKDGTSPCNGPIYCSMPIVVDSHEFNAPVQTALYMYRRPDTKPTLKGINSVRAVNSSPRITAISNSNEGRNLTKYFVDRDSIKYSSYIPSWQPDFNHLRQLSKTRGIYIDAEGQGFINGTPLNVDYHPGVQTMYSDSYLTPNSAAYEQDELKDEKFIVLASDMRYGGYNNIDGTNLQGARLIFSERSVFLRGDIGSDLVIVTPGHVFITGPTNIDSSLNLFILAAQGTAISTVDLEEVVKKNNPDADYIDAAREWIIRAIIYKPGAGIYSTESRIQKSEPITYRGIFGGKSLKLHIIGSCVGGNLQRWINNTEPDSLVIDHDPEIATRLQTIPVTVNLLRLRTRPMSAR